MVGIAWCDTGRLSLHRHDKNGSGTSENQQGFRGTKKG